jgi:hypothetical protein
MMVLLQTIGVIPVYPVFSSRQERDWMPTFADMTSFSGEADFEIGSPYEIV